MSKFQLIITTIIIAFILCGIIYIAAPLAMIIVGIATIGTIIEILKS